MECLRLCGGDVDFEKEKLYIRHGKGGRIGLHYSRNPFMTSWVPHLQALFRNAFIGTGGEYSNRTRTNGTCGCKNHRNLYACDGKKY